jgi:hypothetical protein
VSSSDRPPEPFILRVETLRERVERGPRAHAAKIRALAIALAAVLAACRGHDPVVDGTRLLTRIDNDDWFHVEARVSNQGRDDGAVGLTATVRDRNDGRVLARAGRDIALEGRETMHVVIDLPQPLEARAMADDRLAIEVHAEYPVE